MRLGAFFFLVAAVALGTTTEADAQCGKLGTFDSYPLENGTNLILVNQATSVFSDTDLGNAISKWTVCPELGSRFPAIALESSGLSGHQVKIVFRAGRNDQENSGCEHVERVTAGHNLLSATITLYSQQSNGTSCTPIAEDIGHAIGHILGLDDSTDSACEGTLMGGRAAGTTRQVASEAECFNAARGYHTWRDPVAHIPTLCDLIPELCDDPGSGMVPWWTIPETQPSCTVVTTCDLWGCTSSRTCFFYKLALLPRTEETSNGPSTSIESPPDGALVSGTLEIGGWSRDEDQGVTGTLGFWLDGQPVQLTAARYGDSNPGACAGSTDPNCPYVGFSGSLDTRQLSDGFHTLEVVTAEALLNEPAPGYAVSTFTVDNTPPTASITSPTAGATVSGTRTVNVSASDASGVSVVRFYVDGVDQGRDLSSPFTYTWDSTLWANGSHTLTAKAWDQAGNVRSLQVLVTVSNDLETPKVVVTAPAAGSFRHGTITLAAQASDDQGVTLVEFRVDGAVVGSDSAAPYQVSWASTSVPDGPHTVTARAYDASGNAGVSAPVGVTVDNTLARLYVDQPSNLQSVQGTSVAVAGWALDSSTIASRSFKIDGVPLAVTGLVTNVYRQDVCNAFPDIGDPACPYVGWRASFDSTAFPNGYHTLQVTVTDRAANASTFNRQFAISNPPVTLSFHPIADTTAWQALPTYNNGTSTTLTVRNVDGQGAYAFLKFSVSGVAGAVTAARLLVRTNNALPDLGLYWLVSSSWTETGLTWSNYPAPGGTLDVLNNLVSGTWYSFDVSSYVTGNGTYSVGFASSDPSYGSLWSRESTYPPVLDVTYQP